MPKRKNVEIKTKYKSIEECIENCRDHKGYTIASMSFSHQISGEVYPDGRFLLTARGTLNSNYEFLGRAEERDDGIYMVGEIKPRVEKVAFLYYGIILGIIITLAGFIFQGRGGFLFILFVLFPLFYLITIKYSNALYKDIVKKVT